MAYERASGGRLDRFNSGFKKLKISEKVAVHGEDNNHPSAMSPASAEPVTTESGVLVGQNEGKKAKVVEKKDSSSVATMSSSWSAKVHPNRFKKKRKEKMELGPKTFEDYASRKTKRAKIISVGSEFNLDEGEDSENEEEVDPLTGVDHWQKKPNYMVYG